jgi:hypothetical protein
MEQLPETAMSVILTNLNNTELNSLVRTSQTLNTTVKAKDYQWKLMTEAY